MFVFVNVIGYLTVGEPFLQAVMANFIEQVIGTVLIGIACALPALLYSVERLRFSQQIFLHFLIANTVSILVGVTLNWIPTNSVGIFFTYMIISICIFFLIWFGFYLANKREVQLMKEKLMQLNEEE